MVIGSDALKVRQALKSAVLLEREVLAISDLVLRRERRVELDFSGGKQHNLQLAFLPFVKRRPADLNLRAA